MAAPGLMSTFEGPLSVCNPQSVTTLGRVLQSHGFAGAAVPSALGNTIGKFHFRDDLPLYLRRIAEPTPLHTLIKLFVLDQWLDASAVRDALAPVSLGDARAMGLVEQADDRVHGLVRLSGYDDLILAHDRYDEQSGSLGRDHVLDVNPTTVTLASLMVRRPAGCALDIGTGCGVVALLAARHSERVIGIDTNARALNFAAFNARLNGIEHVEWRLGSLFEPVAGSRFDLIVCNPPYVISPETKYIFRDGGRRGDALCEDIVRRMPEYLTEGGFATVLCNWGLARDEEWSAPLRRWVDGSGCDAWLLNSATQDPLTYAALWNRSRDRAVYSDALDRWTKYFQELGIESIGMGGVILRRRSGAANWTRADHLPEGPLQPGDRHIQRIFASQDFLSSVESDSALLACAFRPADDHRLQQALSLDEGRYVLDEADVHLVGGLGFRGSVDPYTIQLLTRCDDRRTLGDIATELAEKGELGRDQVFRACAAIARRLISLGFLVPSRTRHDT